jgi:hypothetical protein
MVLGFSKESVMCEPFHSIVQFPHSDDHGPTGPRIEAGARLAEKSGYGVLGWGKRILRWLHFSKMGAGHSETMQQRGLASRFLPTQTNYEVAWWNRVTKLDGGFHVGHSIEKDEALECAEVYAKRVSIGDLGQIRRFLEQSLLKSENSGGYLGRFLDGMLNQEGRGVISGKLRKILGSENLALSLSRYDRLKLVGPPLDGSIKVVLGATRKRGFLVPEWADDDLLWKPQGVVTTS